MAVIHGHGNFEFTFDGVSNDNWSYYTMAIYEHNWGLTEVRKSEYQIRVEADIKEPEAAASRRLSVPVFVQ